MYKSSLAANVAKKLSKSKFDRPFMIVLLTLVILGFFIFISASLGVHAREELNYTKIVLNQIFLGLLLGTIGLALMAQIPIALWQKYSFYIFILSCILSLMVFIPGIGFTHGGASRWLVIGPLTFQPAELLKFSFVLYYSMWLTQVKSHITSWKFGIGILLGLLGIVGVILGAQPDIGTLIIISGAAGAMFIVAGGKWSHVAVLITSGILVILLGSLVHPYIKNRVYTFIDPSNDPLGAGYQIQQSLIAIGSGGIAGKGFGQSIQKFSYLPEPMGDSIFSVFAEEWGFIGSCILLSLYLALLLRGYKIASQVQSLYPKFVIVGFITLLGIQASLNIGSMLSILPLTGDPLPFVSQGGSSLLINLLICGIILSMSTLQKTKKNL